MVASVTPQDAQAVARIEARRLTSVLLIEMRGAIQRELQKQLLSVSRSSNGLPKVAVVQQVLINLFGHERTAQEQRLFLLFAAPLMRRAVLQSAAADRIETVRGVHAANLEQSLARLEALAPRHAEMIDLHYFCGLNHDEIGALLGKEEEDVRRDLRFVRAWLAHTRNHGGGPVECS